MASVASARPIALRRKPSPPHAKWPQIPPCARFRGHLRRTITAPHRPRPVSIPIAPSAPPAISSRDFVPWRFSDAGRTHPRLGLHSGVRETYTTAGQSPHHSITSSAVASNLSGIVRPSALAVLRLITNSNLVGCWTDRSAGVVPLRTRSMYPAAWRNCSA